MNLRSILFTYNATRNGLRPISNSSKMNPTLFFASCPFFTLISTLFFAVTEGEFVVFSWLWLLFFHQIIQNWRSPTLLPTVWCASLLIHLLEYFTQNLWCFISVSDTFILNVIKIAYVRGFGYCKLFGWLWLGVILCRNVLRDLSMIKRTSIYACIVFFIADKTRLLISIFPISQIGKCKIFF